MSRRIRSSYQNNQEGGFVLLLTMLIGMTLLVTLTGVINLSLSNLASVRRSQHDISSLYVAEAGADKAIFDLNHNNSYSGTNTACPLSTTGSNPVVLYNDAIKGKATYENCIAVGTITNEKIVYSIGKIYMPSTATSPLATSRIKVVLEGSQTGGYGVVTGPGGLIMSNSATITNGPVFVGGYLDMSSSSAIGSAGAPINVSVGNNRCPTPATSAYPLICSSGVNPNPVNIINTAHIYGSIVANGQTNTSSMSNPGLTASSGAPANALPDYDRNSQKAAATTSITAAAASCSGSGSVTWPANVHITGGNVSISNNCTVTVNGNAWIDGNLSLKNNSIMTPMASLTTAPTIMIDGSSGISLANQSQVSTNSGGTGISFITFYSTAGCNPNCASVSGTDLYNSQSIPTITLGNQGLDAGSTFYARWTKLVLSNSGTIGSISGQTIELNNSGNISFNSTTTGGTLTFDVRYYEKY